MAGRREEAGSAAKAGERTGGGQTREPQGDARLEQAEGRGWPATEGPAICGEGERTRGARRRKFSSAGGDGEAEPG